MGRWDNDSDKWDTSGRERGSKRNYKKIAKYVIAGGFVVVAIVVLMVFIPRAGLSVEIIERDQAMHTLKTITVKINNNYPEELKNIIVQFGDNPKEYSFGNMAPFSAIFVTPEDKDLEFDKVIVSANNGKFKTIKYR